MYKQAYLIIAHKFDNTLRALLCMLDQVENDIFIHMDIKNTTFNEDECKNLIKNSSIFFTERTNVTWGGYSQINSELILLEAATKHYHYDYYHLLSGQDLPLKSAYYIKDFFLHNKGKEFVGFDGNEFVDLDRVLYRYPLQETVGRNRKSFTGRIAAVITYCQKIFNIKRNKGITFQKGPNWFSITDDLANYVVKKKSWIKKVFSNTVCCDEVFLQTVIVNSGFINQVYQMEFDKNSAEGALRLVDWERGGPYVFRIDDYKELAQSKLIYARKFDCNEDQEIIKSLFEMNYKEI